MFTGVLVPHHDDHKHCVSNVQHCSLQWAFWSPTPDSFMHVSEPSKACRGRRMQSEALWWRRTGGRTQRGAIPRKAPTGAASAWVRSSRPQHWSTTTPPWTQGTSASKMNSTARNRCVHHQAVTSSPCLQPLPFSLPPAPPLLPPSTPPLLPPSSLVSCWHHQPLAQSHAGITQ